MIITESRIIKLYTKYEDQGMYDSMDILGKILTELELTNVEDDICAIVGVGEVVKEYVASTYED